MNRKILSGSALAIAALVIAAIQFVPTPPLAVPATLPAEQREAHRLLAFDAIDNFRDLGGYPTPDGRQVKWGTLYRTATLAHSSNADLQGIQRLGLKALVDFRSEAEKEAEPNRLPEPAGFKVVEIPTLDDGNKAMVGEIMARIESGDFDGFDPNALMLEANRQFATTFTPQFRQFIHTVLQANGQPVAWNCSAGKDRTGFAAAILLRILGVPQEVVMQDYLASKQLALEGRKTQMMLLRVFKGDEAADKMSTLLGVEAAWLQAGFDEIDATWGSFDNYVREGIGLSEVEVERLRAALLTSPTTT